MKLLRKLQHPSLIRPIPTTKIVIGDEEQPSNKDTREDAVILKEAEGSTEYSIAGWTKYKDDGSGAKGWLSLARLTIVPKEDLADSDKIGDRTLFVRYNKDKKVLELSTYKYESDKPRIIANLPKQV